MIIGYMRPNNDDMDCQKQIEVLRTSKCTNYFKEEHSSAKKREQLKLMIDDLQKGDKVIATKLSILADSTRQLAELLDVFVSKKAFLCSIKEEIDTSRQETYSFINIVHHLVEFQSDVTSEKTKTGLQRAQEKGVTTGRPRKPDKNVQQAIIMYQSKQYTLAEIKEQTGISKTTLYRYLES